MDVSIIIVNFNSPNVLRDCVSSVVRETQNISYEIIIVDNASADASWEAVLRDFSHVRGIRNAQNLGFAAANNQGIRAANGRYILLLNPDTLIHSNAIQTAVQFADGKPRAAVVGCQTLCGDGELQRNCFLPPGSLNIALRILGLHRLLPKSRFFGRERMTYWDYKDARPVHNVAGCFMLVRRSAIDEVGLLDDSFFMYGEEMDWCLRYRNAGWEVWYTPDAVITHYGGISAAQAPEGMKAEAKKSLLHYLAKHVPRTEYFACRFLLLVLSLTRMPIAFWKRMKQNRGPKGASDKVSMG